jgi:hypothetical protein
VYNFNGHKGYMLKWKLIAPLCKKWSRNRDPDMERVTEMHDHQTKNGYIPKMIHLAEIKEEGVVCYDGNHRREVFNMCNDDELVCIVDVMFDTTQNEVYKAFNNINKSVQLPAIYVEEHNEDNSVKIEILKLVKKFETKYKVFVSASARCHAPNFNRDALTDNIYEIYKSLRQTVSIDQIGKLLSKLNVEYSRERLCRPHSLYKPSVIEKCKAQNLWLFVERTIPFDHVEKVMKSTPL